MFIIFKLETCGIMSLKKMTAFNFLWFEVQISYKWINWQFPWIIYALVLLLLKKPSVDL